MPALCQAPAAPPDSALPPSSASTVTVEVDPQSGPSKPAADKAAKTEKAKEREHRGSFVIAPLPISSPAIGSGIVPVVGYIFPFNKADKVSPPSVVGAAGLLTNNGTRVLAVGGQLYFKENRYQITAGFVRGNINYDLYGSQAFSGLKLPLKQTSQGFR
ncbi:MAG TPA: hypothetical protein VFV92_04420, partial [Candidatus Bathyarchaeia archaeon]|nr:hypothetical protein [Candidatus Bathyarchaeia archaeon]